MNISKYYCNNIILWKTSFKVIKSINNDLGLLRQSRFVSEYATANERLKEAKATGAKALVTSCPWCERNFKDTIKEFGERMEFIISLKSLERQSRLTQIEKRVYFRLL